MKVPYIFLFLIFSSIYSIPLFSAPNDPVHPNLNQEIAVYNKIYVSGTATERAPRPEDGYERERKVSAYGEMKLGDSFSVTANYGYVDHYSTTRKTWSGWDRWGVGAKYYKKTDFASFGGGVQFFGPAVSQPKEADINPDLFLLRAYFGGLKQFGAFSVQATFSFESETNSSGKESIEENFKRFLYSGLTLSYSFTPKTNLLFEISHKTSAGDTITPYSDALIFAPGIQYSTNQNGYLTFSAMIQTRSDFNIDRGFKIGYLYFFGD
ncbi:hypothetical protein [Leptospira sarikeiensis]|uniref:Uncharacterized protein n=1 Tax=Leptospira sarikeiensis TaxID=2484943 RepID=A0A4R9K1P6_9LEPT|nr:hypothetical protein [Leptospira sarikeiensis]TGL59036.1 hypothetical protein EHQ64_16490 [Leptospira sarikeiensis]